MKGWLLDTNEFSELCRLRSELKAAAFVDRQPFDNLTSARFTLAEIRPFGSPPPS